MKYLIKLIIAFSFFGLLLFSCIDNETIQELPDIEEPTPKPEPTPIVTLPELCVDGRYLKNTKGEIVNLHGFTQTYSPYFNSNKWSNYDVEACLSYNKRMVDEILEAGWKFNFVRMHLDPYWSDDPSKEPVRYEGHERFSEARFRKYLDELFVPMAEYFISKGMYVVMRPPGVCPNGEPYQGIELGDSYQTFLLKVWDIVSCHEKIRNNTGVMFELANEPVNIKGTDGVFGSSGDACFANMKRYFQAIVDKIRSNDCNNILWIPGLSYQSSYAGYASHRIEGNNIGYAVHCYPGWYGSDAEEDSSEGIGSSTDGGYEAFQRGWDTQVGPVAEFAPIMVTEIDWAPKIYGKTWGKSITGEAGGKGFGANFKYIADKSGNVSWLFFTTDSEMLAAFKDVPGTPGNYTFLNDPEACPWPIYHWFKEYAEGIVMNGDIEKLELVGLEGDLKLMMGDARYINVRAVYSDGRSCMITSGVMLNSSDNRVVKVDGGKILAVAEGDADITVSYQPDGQSRKELNFTVKVLSPFALKEGFFNPSIWEKGSFDEKTSTLITGQYGFGGWQYAEGLDLHEYNYIKVELGAPNECGVSFRLFDQKSYWTSPAMYDFGNSSVINVDLQNMINGDGVKLDPSHLYIVGFWSIGGKPIVIKSISLEM